MKLGIIMPPEAASLERAKDLGLEFVEFDCNPEDFFGLPVKELAARQEAIKEASQRTGVEVGAVGRWASRILDKNGDVHRRGTMRLATAADEILPLRDPRVQQNQGYLTIVLLSRVITRLGTLSTINTRVIEGLFTMDLAYLQDLYQRINMSDLPVYKVVCPHCNQEIEVPLDFLLS